MSDYPKNIQQWDSELQGGDNILAQHVNELREEIEHIESYLGTDTEDSALSLIQRLNNIIQNVTNNQNNLISTIQKQIKNKNNEATTDTYGVVKKANAYNADGSLNTEIDQIDSNSVVDYKDCINSIKTEINKYFDDSGRLKNDALPTAFNKMIFLGEITIENNNITHNIQLNENQLKKLKELQNGFGGYIILRVENPNGDNVNIYNITQTNNETNPENSAIKYENVKIYDMAQVQYIKNINSDNTITYDILLTNGLGIVSISAEGVPYNTQYVDLKLNDFKSFIDHKNKVASDLDLGHVKINKQDNPQLWDYNSNIIVPRMKDVKIIKNILSSTTQEYFNTGLLHLYGTNIPLDIEYYDFRQAEEALNQLCNDIFTIENDGSKFTGGTLFKNTSQEIISLPENIINNFKQIEIEFLNWNYINLIATKLNDGSIIYTTKGTILYPSSNSYSTWKNWYTDYDSDFGAHGYSNNYKNLSLTNGKIENNKIILNFNYASRNKARFKSKYYAKKHYHTLYNYDTTDLNLPYTISVKY